MLEFKTAFIDPATLLGKKPAVAAAPAVAGFVPTIQKVVELGPSAPHVDEGAELLAALSPGSPPSPPSMGAHYTDVLDELWPSFDEPDERTAARLRVLFDETVKVAGQMNTISIDFFDRVPFSKISLADRTRFHKEFIEYLRRLNEYRKRLDELPPESTNTATIYVGLVKQRQGAGPVPDAIMHLYFANQLDVLADHVQDMSKGFVARVLAGLEATRDAAIVVEDQVTDTAEEAVQTVNTWKWGLGAGIAALVTIVVGSLVLAFAPRRSDAKERA